MTEQERLMLVETSQRSKTNSEQISKIENAIHEIQGDQKAIYSIATSVELIAQRVTTIETKVEDTNTKVNSLSEKVIEAETKPYKQVASNWNSIKLAIVSSICTFLVGGVLGAILFFGSK